MNVYIWTDTPGSITETYTIASFTAPDNTYTRRYLSIAKNGYKIKKVKLDGITKNSSTWGYAAFSLYLTDKDYGSSTNPSYAAPGFGLNYGPNNTGNTSYVSTCYNGQYTNVFQIPNSVIVFNGTNVLSMESTIDTYTATVNGNTYNGSYPSTNKRDIEYVFTSPTVCFYVRQNSGTASSLVATVTYEPI